MDKTLIDDLKALAEVMPNDARHSKTARLRAYLPLVEQALGTGATHSAVLVILKARGLEMTPGVFSATLRRLRGERQSKPIETAPDLPAVALTRSPPTKPKTFHDPSEPVDMESLINHGRNKS